jgi:hypothetical protein
MQKAFPLSDLQPYVSDNIIHPSVHDAVLHAKKDMKKVIIYLYLKSLFSYLLAT